jgi:phospholipid-binding lipoprotein MlaA
VDTRANLLGATRVLDGIALDKYTFVRDAYLVRRRNQVYDGDPPDEPASAAPTRAAPSKP